MTLGLMVTTGISPRMQLMTISPMAFVNTYVSCHPWSLALQINHECYFKCEFEVQGSDSWFMCTIYTCTYLSRPKSFIS
jgi:hypothetical protein